jgi:uncharacterized SAM-binding protein YcdF (DUF218 family)
VEPAPARADDAVLTDELGRNTSNSIEQASLIARERQWRACISVSHYYHLLRIQLAARRQGLITYTVPARMSRRPALEPWYLLREVAAFYAYCFVK